MRSHKCDVGGYGCSGCGDFDRETERLQKEVKKDVERAADEAALAIAELEGWASAPRREEIYKAGFRAGVNWKQSFDGLTRSQGEAMNHDCNLDVSCLCPKCVEARAIQKSDKERIKELEGQLMTAHLKIAEMDGERNTQAERVAELSQYKVAALAENLRLREALESIILMSIADQLPRGASISWIIEAAKTALSRQISNVPASAASSAEASTETGRTGRPLSKPEPEMAAGGTDGHAPIQPSAVSSHTVQACCEVCGWKPGIPNTDCPEDACRMKQAADQDTSIDRSIDHNTTVVNREQDAQATPETDISKPTCQPGRHTGGSK